MTGSKITAMTSEEMRARRACGEAQTDWARLHREQKADAEPEEDEDSPDATAALREVVTRRRAGRPAGSGSKEQVAIRFDREVLAAFRAAGPGWQTRMNEALKDWLKTHIPA
ncbi:BrnA antitoxin family protein [Candidatus Symbiobacter mobilis]|nr:BrnA antitoxin family protein [Candidatus Symbiobacter mobilis]